MHFAAELTSICESFDLLHELKLNFFFLFEFLENLSFRLKWTNVIHDCIVDFLVILVSGWSQLYLKSNNCLIGNVMIIAGKLWGVAFHF